MAIFTYLSPCDNLYVYLPPESMHKELLPWGKHGLFEWVYREGIQMQVRRGLYGRALWQRCVVHWIFYFYLCHLSSHSHAWICADWKLFYSIQTLMNAQQEVTPAILMLCVTTPRDRTTAHVKRDLLVTASIVQVRSSQNFWFYSCHVHLCFFAFVRE